MRRPLNVLLLLLLPLLATLPAEAGWDEGVAAFKSGNFTQAAKEFQAVVQEREDWDGGHFMLGQTLLKLNRNEEALAQLRRAYDLNPNQVSYQLALAQAYVANRRFSDAAQLLGKINPASLPKAQQASYHELASVAFERSGQTDRALDALAKVVAAAPNDADAQYRYGLAAFNAGQTSTAVAALEKAVRLDGADMDKKDAYVKVLIRSARTSSGSAKQSTYQKALQAAGDLAAKQPTYEHLLTLGEVQLGAQAYGDAAGTFGKAAAKNGNDWLVHYYIGQARTSLEQYQQAEQALRTALTKTNSADDQRKIWSQIGFVDEKLKNFTAAKDAYRKAGNDGAVARVEENERIAKENQDIEESNAKIKQMEEERKALEKELRELPGGRPPR
jgi:tetratricopeptide (TPR) repeat protein